MNDEPSDYLPHEPMDSRLLQLERELFSLTPVEAPRHFINLLENSQQVPCAVGKVMSVAPPAFKWSRIVVPAAAAVVVVSVLQSMDPAGASLPVHGSANRIASTPQLPVSDTRTYVLKSEPIYLSPAGNGLMAPSLSVQPGIQPGLRLSVPRRNTGAMPVSFH